MCEFLIFLEILIMFCILRSRWFFVFVRLLFKLMLIMLGERFLWLVCLMGL